MNTRDSLMPPSTKIGDSLLQSQCEDNPGIPWCPLKAKTGFLLFLYAVLNKDKKIPWWSPRMETRDSLVPS